MAQSSEIAGIEDMIGLFLNTVPVRVRLRPDEPLLDFLTRLQSEQAELLPYHHAGLADGHGSGRLRILLNAGQEGLEGRNSLGRSHAGGAYSFAPPVTIIRPNEASRPLRERAERPHPENTADTMKQQTHVS